MRQFFRFVLMALVLLTVALVSALTAMRFAIHGREVVIPKLIGSTFADAQKIASPAGLGVTLERQYYSPDVPEGKIMSQVPTPGTKVRRGWTIRVAQSLGPQRVTIPDVTGESERVAELTIRRRGLDIGSTAQISFPDAKPDQVLSQDPAPNASGVLLPKINLLLADTVPAAEFVMPNFVGSPLGSAVVALQEAGMRLGKVSVASPSSNSNDAEGIAMTFSSQAGSASMIVSQSPPAGQKVVLGGAISFEVR